jgi:alcohol dehydrogenase (cytochrome c)
MENPSFNGCSDPAARTGCAVGAKVPEILLRGLGREFAPDSGFEWSSPSYNPTTNMLVAPTVDWCGVFRKADELRYLPGQHSLVGSYTSDPVQDSRGWLTAVNASTGDIIWKYQSKRPMLAAVTTTSANLVFTGELTGNFVVVDANQGDVLYRFNIGGPVTAGVNTYANGKQYVGVASGVTAGFWKTPPASSILVIFGLP